MGQARLVTIAAGLSDLAEGTLPEPSHLRNLFVGAARAMLLLDLRLVDSDACFERNNAVAYIRLGERLDLISH